MCTYDHLIKLMIIGDSGVGKTSLLMKYTDNTFHTSTIQTIGIDFKLKHIDIDGQKIKLQILDTAGQERFYSITKAHLRNAMGFILVYDVTNRQSFESLSYWLSQIQTFQIDSSRPIIIVGNKNDTTNKLIYDSEVKSRYPTLTTFLTSAKDGNGVDDIFEYISRNIIKQKINNNNIDNINFESINLLPHKYKKNNKNKKSIKDCKC